MNRYIIPIKINNCQNNRSDYKTIQWSIPKSTEIARRRLMGNGIAMGWKMKRLVWHRDTTLNIEGLTLNAQSVKGWFSYRNRTVLLEARWGARYGYCNFACWMGKGQDEINGVNKWCDGDTHNKIMRNNDKNLVHDGIHRRGLDGVTTTIKKKEHVDNH